jgi:pSer/pThr/pTyr-binding forkhead associated (FHA) protein
MVNSLLSDHAASHAPESAPPTHLLLQIYFPQQSVTTIGIEVKDELVLGRADDIDNYYPDIDLIPFGALENGISRHHAVIKRMNNRLYIQDAKSKNGSHLNDETLKNGQLYPLADGDTVILGQLKIMVRFVSN